GGYHCGVGSGPALQAGSQVRGPSDDRLLLRRLLADNVPNHDHASRNSNSRLQRLAARKQELTDLCHEIESGPHGTFSIVLVRLGITKIDEDAITHEPGDMSAHLSDHRGTR